MGRIRNYLINKMLKSIYPDSEDMAMALLCEGARILEVSESRSANTVKMIKIKPHESEDGVGYNVTWE